MATTTIPTDTEFRYLPLAEAERLDRGWYWGKIAKAMKPEKVQFNGGKDWYYPNADYPHGDAPRYLGPATMAP